MADLSAVLRKTIDGLPNATPELRAKVYEKARAAIARQIDNANPPLSDDVVAMRRNALEEAIEATEAHYLEGEAAAVPPPIPPAEEPAPRRPAVTTPVLPPEAPRRAPPEAPRMPRAEPAFTPAPPPPPVRTEERAPSAGISKDDARPLRRSEPRFEDRQADIASMEPDGGFDIPDADTSAPRFSPQRAPRRATNRKPLLAGVAAVVLLGLLGGGAYYYGDQIAGLLSGGGSQTAEGTDTPADSSSNGTDVAAVPPVGEPATGSQPPATGEGQPKRRFTQRLLADGTEVDEGPASGNANAFDEGTDISAATPEPTPPPTAGGQPAATPPTASPQTASLPPANNNAPAVAQKAMFYEERTETQQGTQQAGNVVWSLVNEPPADGEPPEPAIRAVADVPNDNIKLTMTIRRNLDATLPASHVIELQFDVPPGFSGGQIANVQRLALKPSEEARGDPLIGVAGKISDGFFIIALNNLDKATETNLALLGNQEWIDIPIAYATGRRALMSIEKGVPGDRVFKQALEAWATRT